MKRLYDRRSLLLCLLASMSVQVCSQEDGDLNSNPVDEAESRFLFINMLEFLGEFEVETGEWISPDILGNETFADLDGTNNDEAVNLSGESPVMSAAGNGDE